jgi:hypothetical protein
MIDYDIDHVNHNLEKIILRPLKITHIKFIVSDIYDITTILEPYVAFCSYF